MNVFQVVMECLHTLKDTLSAAHFDFWSGDTSKNMWLFFTTFCGADILFLALYKRWSSNGRGWL